LEAIAMPKTNVCDVEGKLGKDRHLKSHVVFSKMMRGLLKNYEKIVFFAMGTTSMAGKSAEIKIFLNF
jgi:hypothetical protein